MIVAVCLYESNQNKIKFIINHIRPISVGPTGFRARQSLKV